VLGVPELTLGDIEEGLLFVTLFFVELSIMIGAAGADADIARSFTLFKNAGAVGFSIGIRSAILLPKLALAEPVNVGCS